MAMANHRSVCHLSELEGRRIQVSKTSPPSPGVDSGNFFNEASSFLDAQPKRIGTIPILGLIAGVCWDIPLAEISR